ncbi:hypothetical protein LC609_14700 [Nostoc sp. XA013]|nr:hypothetical protein [Nostoc sp. XA013]
MPNASEALRESLPFPPKSTLLPVELSTFNVSLPAPPSRVLLPDALRYPALPYPWNLSL